MITMAITTENLIDWNDVLQSLIPESGDPITMDLVLDKSTIKDTNSKVMDAYTKISQTWIDAGYDLKNIKWFDYYPGEHFDKQIETVFENLVNAKARRVWISEIMPGRSAPYHWDVDDHEEFWLNEGPLIRYTCFIEKPVFGHIFVLDNQHYYNEPQHSVIQWNDHRAYHAGTNCGPEPFYLFHFVGTPR